MHDSADVRHVICDIRDDGIEVTEPKTGRVFKIVERAQPAAQAARADEETVSSAALPPKREQRAPMIAAKPMLTSAAPSRSSPAMSPPWRRAVEQIAA